MIMIIILSPSSPISRFLWIGGCGGGGGQFLSYIGRNWYGAKPIFVFGVAQEVSSVLLSERSSRHYKYHIIPLLSHIYI